MIDLDGNGKIYPKYIHTLLAQTIVYQETSKIFYQISDNSQIDFEQYYSLVSKNPEIVKTLINFLHDKFPCTPDFQNLSKKYNAKKTLPAKLGERNFKSTEIQKSDFGKIEKMGGCAAAS